ncbi:TPM domain-containing protein [Candidatus Poseidoniaceae archaeon]|nr:TPM domain-containing protein [Candidatus Poseidoniaceae archaeon]
MSHFSKVILLAIITILLLPAVQAEQTFPIEPEGEWYVLDAADLFDNQTEQRFSLQLAEIRNQTNTLVRVVTIESMADYGVDEGREYFMGDSGYARQMFQHYNMEGNEEKAILITFSEQDRKFKFVMPDHNEIQQKRSGEVYYDVVQPALSNNEWEWGTELAILYAEDIIEAEAVDDLIVLAMFLIPFILCITLFYLAYNKAKRYKTTGLEAVIAEQRMIQEMTKARGMKVMEHLQEKESGTFQMEFLDQLNTVTEGYPSPVAGSERDYAKEAIVYKIKKEFDKASIGINTRADELGIGYDLPLEYAEAEQDLIELNKFEAFAKATFPSPIAFGLIIPAVIGFFNFLDRPMDAFYFYDDLVGFVIVFLVITGFAIAVYRAMREDVGIFFPIAFLVNKSTEVHKLGTSGWGGISSSRLSSGIVLTGMTAAMIVSPRWTVTVSGVDEYGNNMYDYNEHSHSSGGSGCGSSCGSSCGGGCGGGGCGGGGDF